MTQYLMSVHTVEGEAEPTGEDLQRLYAQVDTFNQKLMDAGIWVFGGGLEPIEATTTVDATGTEPIITDGPFAEAKEWIGGFWILEAPDLDAALKLATEASAACEGPVEVRPFQPEPSDPSRVDRSRHRADLPRGARPRRRLADPPVRRHRHRRGRRRRGAARRRRAVAGGRRTPQPWRVADDHRGPQGHRQDPPRVAPRRQVPAGRHDHGRHPSRAHRAGRRRPPPADLHLLPPGPGPRGTGGPDPAPPGRADRARDRLGVPGHRDHDGPAHHPGEEEDRRRAHPLPRACRRGPARAADRRAGGALPRLQRGLPRHLRARTRAGGPDRRGDPAVPGAALAAADRARGRRSARADAAHRRAPDRPLLRRRAGAAGRPGPRLTGTPRRSPRVWRWSASASR